ncbi:hypothetical protein KL86DES1_21430 [uncultured Desulfovibrio sp.]|uniref:Uncharacterized protein n=1 Tax=uncultured Desulfovibrio sp. TaxID=167968 RepID=A0A212L7Y0_9BACT|nr:hypothetical protein KL86DES1_21430 [uncultured Desulfovibrio sp.]VZH34327.1 conserved protein of unknown function [Desulfovibrio sp. 86]
MPFFFAVHALSQRRHCSLPYLRERLHGGLVPTQSRRPASYERANHYAPGVSEVLHAVRS